MGTFVDDMDSGSDDELSTVEQLIETEGKKIEEVHDDV